MAEYIKINKDTFPTFYKRNLTDYGKGWNACLKSVLQHKDANVVEVRHGRWISYLDGEHIMPERYYQCSECGRRGYTKMHPYCNCGAKMDGNGGTNVWMLI